MPDMRDSLGHHLWRSHWHLVAHRNELPAHGDFLRLNVLDQEVVVFNDAGTLVAFDNRCPHRGARMFLSDHGRQAATCGYHGWTYNHGTWLIPDRAQFKSCHIDKVDFRRWQIDWAGDFLFVSDQPSQSLSDQLGEVLPLLEDISFGVTGRHDWNAYRFECDWKIAMENALEPCHVPMVHPGSLGLLELQPGHNEFHGRNSVWYAPVGNPRMARSLARISELFALDFQYAGYMSIYIYPFTMLSSTYGLSYSLQHFLPSLQPESTHFYSRMLTMAVKPERDPEIVASFLASTAATNRRVFQEDHEVCKRVPLDTWSPEPPVFAADAEEKLIHFRASCRDTLRDLGSDTAQPPQMV